MSGGDNSARRLKIGAAVALVIAVAVGVAALLWTRSSTPKELRLDEYLAAAQDGNVRSATISGGNRSVAGELTDGTRYRVVIPAGYSPDLIAALRSSSAAVEIEAREPSSSFWVDLASTIIPLTLLVGAFLFVMARYQGGGKAAAFGRAKTRRAKGNDNRITFADVAGSDEAVEELAEIAEFLRNPARFRTMGARIPKGVLLYGAPGTGKTLLARAVAGEASAEFFSISGSDFVEMFVGVGASRVRDLFQQAAAAAPSIVFVDEIDAVGRQRGAGLGGGHDEREQTLNQLLVEMDGFDGRTGVIVLAATNRPDILDPALLRPGRFDRHVSVDLPDLAGRRAILDVHARGKMLAQHIDLTGIARRTPGFSGADLANVLNEGALLAARRHLAVIGMDELDEAVDRVLAGPMRPSRVVPDADRRVVAVHEAGHAIVGHALPTCDPIHKVSVVARGRALGWTIALPLDERSLRTRAELAERLAMLLGGRAAEELVFGEVTTGAADDIQRATELARLMVTEYGMSQTLGPRRLGSGHGDPFLGRSMGHEEGYSPATGDLIDREIDRLVADARKLATQVLQSWRPVLDRMAEELIARESLGEVELEAIFAGQPLRAKPVNEPAPPLGHRATVAAPPPRRPFGRRADQTGAVLTTSAPTDGNRASIAPKPAIEGQTLPGRTLSGD